MDYRTYQKLRAYCMLDLGLYINIPEYETTMYAMVKLHGQIGRIEREQQLAHHLFQCHDLTPREVAAAELLGVVSNHRAITWQREPSPPNGRAPAPPLDASTADRLACQTRDAVARYAAFLPEPERAVLHADFVAKQAPESAPGPVAGSNGVTVVDWSLVQPKAPRGYSVALFELLKAAHACAEPRPTARDVLSAWRQRKPSGCITEVLESSVKYEDSEGTIKVADLAALRAAINRLTNRKADDSDAKRTIRTIY